MWNLKTRQELTDELSDVILGNVGRSSAHTGFDYSLIIECEVDRRKGKIWMMLDDGTCWNIQISRAKCLESED